MEWVPSHSVHVDTFNEFGGMGALGTVAPFFSSSTRAGATKLKPRNKSWAAALGGMPGESVWGGGGGGMRKNSS